ncbi:hypothetical protein PF008_g20898 [Phytophthora fragariae]|uniref:Uncharacterized protein n=1 Tax=Phytophthora fragariae TaxID=53985 RepID=A0A6G0QYE9_9STRA|nr:hypothetical protein PF008_g20898 [Phytophthora fragariae]
MQLGAPNITSSLTSGVPASKDLLLVIVASAHLFQAPKVIRSPEAVVVYQTLAAAQLFQPQRILAASKQRQLASASPPLSF